MEEKRISKESIAIIGGADGPTSVFIAGRKKGIPIKHRIKNRIYRWKGKQASKKITAGERTLSEAVTYAVKKYNATEVDISLRKYATQKNCLKESLISRYKPELLDKMAELTRPDDEQIPMDFHIYELSLGDGRLELEIDYHWNIFGISYSGNKKTMKQMKEIAKDLYLYYGVSAEDIQQKSERYHSLLATLSI